MIHSYPQKFLLELYRTMIRIRLCEESFVAPIISGEIRCPVHLSTGEEAVAAGVCAALAETDYIFGTHRSHGHYLAKGGAMRELVAEIYGKVTGCSKGRGGSMHLTFPEKGMVGAVPIVAATISLALGAALASSIRQDGRVVVSFFGDGAAGEGVIYESLNFAVLKKLPILFVCENNLYSTHMPIRECRPNLDIFKIAQPFEILSMQVDGNNLLEVYEAAQTGVVHARNGAGPVFIECRTYRLRGHVGPDDNIQGTRTDIRPPEEVEAWKKKDPLPVFKQVLLADYGIHQETLDIIRTDAAQEVVDAHTYAQESSYPEEDEVTRYVFTAANPAI